jgi:hypothetical protein
MKLFCGYKDAGLSLSIKKVVSKKIINLVVLLIEKLKIKGSRQKCTGHGAVYEGFSKLLT